MRQLVVGEQRLGAVFLDRGPLEAEEEELGLERGARSCRRASSAPRLASAMFVAEAEVGEVSARSMADSMRSRSATASASSARLEVAGRAVIPGAERLARASASATSSSSFGSSGPS